MVIKTYRNKDDIPKTIKTANGKVYHFYRTVSDNADKQYWRNLEKKVEAMGGWSLWMPFKLIRTDMWAIYIRTK